MQISTHHQPTTPTTHPGRHHRPCLAPRQQPPTHRPHGCSLRTPTGCPRAPPSGNHRHRSPPQPRPHRGPDPPLPRQTGRVVLGAGPRPATHFSQRLRPRAPRPDIRGPRAPAPTATAPGQALLRKEVIQPHLPVRLPCYDFVPIASPTFDGSPPHGLGHRLRVLPTFVT
jgi:hypothetical protein